ncbi:TrmH family RNA methyltransferase [Candidatus Nitrospira nitrificans]|uniref:Putative 23S rRNA methyltransferase RlmB n=1 Tax=Candidatus Nitrospira nitrificans TaxID=1742973 RepID=A0A0S4L2F7_9BACT|nr:RNA methyltransferase [Candidatus Nitrospira nitrificans]CUS31825.1 putative 23S rRNA methyltransferase RlmB [Candidatus Nitrospira nitrificans]
MAVALQLPALTRAGASRVRQLLRDKKVRSTEGAFVLEGAKSCRDLIHQSPQAILSLIVSPGFLCVETEVDRQARARLPASQFLCPDADFERLTDVEMPQGIVAVVRQPRWDETHVFKQSRVLGLYGDRLQDPANVGAIIRTAAALNLSGVWLSADSADHFSPKVVRATAGSILSLPVFHTWDWRAFSSYGCDIYSAVLDSADQVPIRTIRTIPSRLMVAVGNEGAGLTPDIVKASRVRFSIPLAEGVESLNVAATAAISAFYFSGLRFDSDSGSRRSDYSA